MGKNRNKKILVIPQEKSIKSKSGNKNIGNEKQSSLKQVKKNFNNKERKR